MSGRAPAGFAEAIVQLRDHLSPKTVIVGVGQPLRGDDGVGCWLAEKLAGRIQSLVLNGGPAPENVAGRIVRAAPTTILILDAVAKGDPPGAVHVVGPDSAAEAPVGTHGPSLGPLLDFLRQSTEADCIVLGIEPAGTAVGEGLSEPVRASAEALLAWFIEAAADGPTD